MSAGLTPETQSTPCAKTRDADRRTLRRQLFERRLTLTLDDCEKLSASVRTHVQAHFPELAGLRVGFCWPVNNEPDLRPLMINWIEADQSGFSALLPVVLDPAAPLLFREWTRESPMFIDRYGIPTPAAGEFLVPEALLIPVNAFDAAGYRIGYGGGFFDRTLATLRPSPLSIGVGFELSRVDSIRPEAHDIRLDAMVTEAGVFRHQ